MANFDNMDNEFDVPYFEKKLSNLKDTQDSIQSVSNWCLQHRPHHKKIVSSWLNVLKQVKIEQRLTLFHLANDVIQYSKRKNYEFVESWGTTLQRATTLVRDDKIKHKVLRIFQIWGQRGIFSEEFLTDLNGLLSIAATKKIQPTPKEIVAIDDDFQPLVLVSNIRDCVRLETDTDTHLKSLCKTPLCDVENIKVTLKDREHVEDVEKDMDESVNRLDVVLKCLTEEIKARSILITLIEKADTFYLSQRGDVKVVANAYKNFGNRIKNMKKKLDELSSTLPSPMPSPDINAPSPEPDNDFILPGENNYTTQSNNSFLSYIGKTLPFDINDFSRESITTSHSFLTNKESGGGAQPIQVINSRSAPDDNNFNIPDIFKNMQTNTYSPTVLPQPVPAVINYNLDEYQLPPSNNLLTSYSGSLDSMTNYNTQNHPQSSSGNNYTNSGRSPILPPLLPPPLPPALDRNDSYDPGWDISMNWNSSQDSSGFELESIETPVSPPHFERKGINTSIVEYIDGDVAPNSGARDVDHRQLKLPNIQEGAISIEKRRSLDIDHRNLISLTGSPIPKSMDEVPPPPEAPPLLWSGVDMDFRQQDLMTESSNVDIAGEMDKDYRVPPMHGVSLVQTKQSSISPPTTTTTSMPLAPPPLHNMDEFLMTSTKDEFELPSPSKLIHGRKIPNTKTTVTSKNQNGRDNVESVDMEMSDDDNNEEMFFNQQFSNVQMTQQQNSNLHLNMNMNHLSRPPLLPRPPKFDQSPQQQQMPKPQVWQNNHGGNEWESPPPPRQFFQQNRPPFLQQNFRGNSNRGSPYFRNQRGSGPGGNFRGNFRGNMQRGGGKW